MADWYYKVSGAWKTVNEAFFKSSGSWKEIQEAYVKVGGAWKQFYTAFVATSFVTKSSGSSTATVPDGANAIHIQAAVGGGASGVAGAEYDKSGGESGGTGGGSGAYISDKVFSVTEGQLLTFDVGSGGTGGFNGPYPNYVGDNGGLTRITYSGGQLFSLGGGGAGGSSGGTSPNGTVRTNTPSSGGSATINATPITSGTFREANGATVTFATATTLDQGPVGTFNQSGNGVAGVTGDNCSGDNCQIAGKNGGASYAGAIPGGTGRFGSTGDAGTRGSGGGGGGGQPQTGGGAGGAGEIKYRFLRIT